MEQGLEHGLSVKECQAARLARDARYDGRFFVAVSTTGIFCRPICPAIPPKEEHVTYFKLAVSALGAGFRPCLRCRPESAPDSWAWKGTESTFQRGLSMIESGFLREGRLSDLSDKLGVSDRYFRKLFKAQMGMSPKRYDLLSRLMFSKQLLHGGECSITDIAFAAGFRSVRRFNDAFKKELKLNPSQVRGRRSEIDAGLKIHLAFRPPLDWQYVCDFYETRKIYGMEMVQDGVYSRTFRFNGVEGLLSLSLHASGTAVCAHLQLAELSHLRNLVRHLRRVFDLDTDPVQIHAALLKSHPKAFQVLKNKGVRIPGCWDPFEAGIRAICGQQVRVSAGRDLVQSIVNRFGSRCSLSREKELSILFPEPETLAGADFSFLKIPKSRMEMLRLFSDFFSREDKSMQAETRVALSFPNEEAQLPDYQQLLKLKGVGPWTLQYLLMRGLSDPNQFLVKDLIIRQALEAHGMELEPKDVAPWGSYATLQIWDSKTNRSNT